MIIPHPLPDFMIIYYGARCLIQHYDPYQVSQFWSVYQTHGGYIPSDPLLLDKLRLLVALCVNLPTTLVLAIPLAMLPWKIAAAICLILIGGSFVISCCTLWGVAAELSPRLAGFLVFLVLINSGFLLYSGNAAGLVIGLCVIATCCFVQDRFAWAGVVCMAVSLLLKPHDSALVWVYFFLAGGTRAQAGCAIVGAGCGSGFALSPLGFTCCTALVSGVPVKRDCGDVAGRHQRSGTVSRQGPRL